MIKLKLIIIFCLCFVAVQTKKQNTFQKIAYFKVWEDDALTKNLTLSAIVTHLKKVENGGFSIMTTPPLKNTQHYDFIGENGIIFIAWSNFLLPPLTKKEQSYLWQLETPLSIIVPPPPFYKQYFNKIFTYYRPAVDNKQVIYIPIPYNYPQIEENALPQQKTTLVSLMNSYFTGGHYNLRSEIVQWFLEKHPKDIVIYGRRWHNLKPSLSEKAKFFFQTQYKGYAQNKYATIAHSKFTIAFENYRHDDYVTEKIYDAMTARSVPIYSGAPNIASYVPKECFIDFHAFKNYEKLYTFLNKMDDATYQSYIDCIEKFMTNPERHPNHYKNVVRTILSHIRH